MADAMAGDGGGASASSRRAERDALFVQHVNHAPQARWLAEERRCVGRAVLDPRLRLSRWKERGARRPRRDDRAVEREQHAVLSARSARSKNLNRAYARLRPGQIGGRDRLAAHRRALHRSRHDVALRDGLRPGMSERELGDLVERAYVAHGAINVIHYIGVDADGAPDLAVPRQFPLDAQAAKGRRRRRGDHRDVLGLSGPGAALASRVGEEPTHALSRPACDGRCRLRCHHRGAQSRRDASAGDRGLGRDRGRRLHHHRRSAARLRRRLSAADPRLHKPARPARCRTSRSAPAGRRDAAQRGDARPQGRRADRRNGADHGERASSGLHSRDLRGFAGSNLPL